MHTNSDRRRQPVNCGTNSKKSWYKNRQTIRSRHQRLLRVDPASHSISSFRARHDQPLALQVSAAKGGVSFERFGMSLTPTDGPWRRQVARGSRMRHYGMRATSDVGRTPISRLHYDSMIHGDLRGVGRGQCSQRFRVCCKTRLLCRDARLSADLRLSPVCLRSADAPAWMARARASMPRRFHLILRCSSRRHASQ